MAASDSPGLGIFLVLVGGSVALVVFTVTLLFGLTIAGGISADLSEGKDPTNKTASPDPVTGTAVSFEQTFGSAEILEVFSVRDTTNTSVNLTGADDSYVQSRDPFTIAEDANWSVSTWARADADAAGANMTAVSANGRVLIQFNGSHRLRTTVNESQTVDYGNLTTVSAANDPDVKEIYDNETVYNASGAALVEGTDYEFYTNGSIEWFNTSNTTDGETAPITYHYRLYPNWTAWYFDDGSADSYRVNVTATDQPGSWTLVTAASNGSHLWIYANTTKGEVENVTTSNIADANVNATNWDGRLDETRTFDDATNATEQSTLHSNPIAPRTDRERTARITFDEGTGSVTAIYFTSTRADLSNFSWDAGLRGHRLIEGTDYELDTGDGTITALAGGRIDGAPVVWIDYRYRPLDRVGEVSKAIQPAYRLFGVSALVIPAAAVLAVLIGGIVAAVTVASGMELPGGRRENGR